MEGQKEVKVRNRWKGILICHGIMKVWSHIQNLVNLNHPGVLNHLRSLGQGQRMNKPLLKFALSVEEIIMKKIVQGFYSGKRDEVIPPQPGKQSLQADKSEAKIREKWDPVREDGHRQRH